MPRPAPGSLEALRNRNREAVIASLRVDGPISRADVARLTGLSRSTVSTVVAELIRDGIVREQPQASGQASGSGRPGTPLTLNPDAGAVLAIDLAPTTLSVTIFDLGLRTLGSLSHAYRAMSASRREILDHIADCTTRVIEQAGVQRAAIIGGAMAIPAPIANDARTVGQQSVIPGIVGAGLEQELAELLGVPLLIENDANLHALAELAEGAADGHRNAIYLEVSEGIGAGLIVDGRLHRGAHGTAGEIGHTPVVPDGPVCRCGNRGCLELVAAVGAITDSVSEQLREQLDVTAVIERAETGDPMCRRILRDAGTHIGTVVGFMYNLMNPTVIVIGGALSAAWALVEPSLREALDRSAISNAIDDLTLVPCQLHGPAGRLLGARTLVLQDLGHFPLPDAAVRLTA